MLHRWGIKVVSYGPSQHDSDSYFLMRAYSTMNEMQQKEDAFYGSTEWENGPRQAILALIINFTNIVLPANSMQNISAIINKMNSHLDVQSEKATLSSINKQFIHNFLSQNAALHSGIIDDDFVCIESNGSIVSRETYLENWSTDFKNSGYKSFSYGEEVIRVFGNTALIRAKTVYIKEVNKKHATGYTIYTDTYVKKAGQWKCVQVQITPVK